MPSITTIVKNNTAEFQYIRDNKAWYRIDYRYYDSQFMYWEEDSISFPVPLDDIGQATLSRSEKAIHLMRWIRKWKDQLEA